jgi:ribosomal protein L11 methyltransferase
MMVKAMEGLAFAGKQVFDFGTGTGVLAILAEKLGAEQITAIDNDEWSINNSEENFNSNNCHKILLFKDESIPSEGVYDIILANINRNIILQHMASIKQHLAKDGVVLLSGLLTGDEPVIMETALQQHLILCQRFEMNGWICLQLVKSK